MFVRDSRSDSGQTQRFRDDPEAADLRPYSNLEQWQRVLGQKGIYCSRLWNCLHFHDPTRTPHVGTSAEVSMQCVIDFPPHCH